MIIEDVIKALSKSIKANNKDGYFLVLKSITPNSKFKVYKNIKFTLYYLSGREKEELLTVSYSERITEDIKDKIIDIVSQEFLCQVFKWMISDTYKQIVNGTYKIKV